MADGSHATHRRPHVAWDLRAHPPEYTVQPGDTLAGLAARYLGSRARAGELRDLQVNEAGTRGPNGIYLNHRASDWATEFRPGVSLLMPLEAAEKVGDVSSSSGPPASNAWKWWLGGAIAFGLVGFALYEWVL